MSVEGSHTEDERAETVMAVWALGDLVPTIHHTAFVHPDATVIGAVTIGPYASVWPGAVLRGDDGEITIGARSSVQDGSVVHGIPPSITSVGEGSVVGHLAHLHGCVVGNGCLIGSCSVVLDHGIVENGAGVAAAALLPARGHVPSGQIAVGVPAVLRDAPRLADVVARSVHIYLQLSERHRSARRVDQG